MGYYIQTPKNRDKATQLMELHGAEPMQPMQPSTLPEDKALICVVENPLFDAAALCYSDSEFEAFNDPMDFRPKVWLIMDKAKAHELAGYTPR